MNKIVKKAFTFPLSWAVLMFLTLVFTALLFAFFYSKWQTIDQLQARLQRLQERQKVISVLRSKEEGFQKELESTDHFYLYHQLESYIPLEEEIRSLETLSDYVKQDRNLEQRLRFLTGSANRIVFQEENIRKEGDLQETEEMQKNPIEIDLGDLKELLARTEGAPTAQGSGGKPQIIIKNFTLERKSSLEKETYLMQMHLIKREKLKK